MDTNTRQIAQRYNSTFHEGIVIHAIVPNSHLDAQNIEAGSVIVAVNEHPVRNVDEFFDALDDYNLAREGVRADIIGPSNGLMRVRLYVE